MSNPQASITGEHFTVKLVALERLSPMRDPNRVSPFLALRLGPVYQPHYGESIS
jgi:hypothetical protein